LEFIFKMRNILFQIEKKNIRFENEEVSEELLNLVIQESKQVKDYGEFKIVTEKNYECYAKIDSSGKL